MAISNVQVTANTSTISVNTSTNTVSVTSTPTTVSVGTATQVTTAEIRSALSNVAPILYNSGTGVFSFDSSSVFTGRTTDDLAQGSTNKYFTTTGATVNTDALPQGSTNKYFTTTGATINTDALPEGSTNLYFTPARTRSNISVVDGGGIGNLSYSSNTGVITYNGPSDLELRDKISVTDNGGFGSLSYSNATGIISFTGTSTSDVRGSISAGAGVTYNSSTGVISALGLNSTTSSFATEGVMANVHAIFPTGRQYSEAYDVGISYDSSTGGFSVAYPQKSFHARFKNTAIDTTRGHVLAVVGYDASNDIPIVDYLDTTNAGNSIVAGVYMESIGTVSNSAVTYPEVAVATQGYITSGAFHGLSGLKTGDILYATTTGSAPNTRGGYTSTIPTNTYNKIVDPIGKIVEQDGTLYTLYIDVTGPAIDTTTLSLTQGNATTRAGRPVIGYTDPGTNVALTTNSGLSLTGNETSGYTIGTNLGALPLTNFFDATDYFVINGGGSLSPDNVIRAQHLDLQLFDNANAAFIANAGVTSYLSTVPLTVGGNLNVSGNIIATGNIDYENVTDLFVTDQKITLNANAATDANVEIIANRPQTTSVKIKWNEDTDRWTFTNDGSTFYNLPTSTSDVAEGTNLYYTVARANTAITDFDGVLTPSSLTATGNIQGSFVKGNGSELTGITTSQVAEGTNLYYTDGRFDTRLGTKTTSDLTEGTNLYYTTARANSAIGNYKGTIDTTNTISGTTVTATTELKTNQVKPNSSDVITVAETNDLKLGAKISDVSYVTGNIHQAGTYIDRPTTGGGLSDGRVLTTSSEFSTAVGSTQISGMVATNSNSWPNGLGGIGGTATYVEGSPDVVVTGLQTLDTVGAPGYIFGGRTTEDPANKFQPGMQIITALSAQHQTGAMPKNAYALSLNSSDSGGNANIRMSENATFSKTYTVTAVADQIAMLHTVENPTTGDRRALHGVTASFGIVGNDFVGMATTDHPVEGTSQLGANYFQHFSNTSLPSSINANITPSMITTANVASTSIQDIIEMKSPNGYYRFPDSVLIGDQSLNTSRNTYFDSVPGFGLNIQWSGNGDTDKYTTNVQTAMTFQAFTDNALQNSSGFEDRAGPRIMLSSFKGNKNDAWQGWYPRQNQELGKYAWWSTTGETATPGSTVPPAAITALASNDWDTDANMSADVIHYAAAKVAGGSKQMFLAYKDGETLIGSHSTKKVSIGEGGTINTDVRANASLTATHVSIDSTETELFNRLQLLNLTTAEINALSSPQAGQMVFNTTLALVCVYNGTGWRKLNDAAM